MRLIGTPEVSREMITWSKKEVRNAKHRNEAAFKMEGCNHHEPIVWMKTRAPNPFDPHVEDLEKKKKKPKNIMDYMFDESAIQYEFYKSGKVRMRIPCKWY